MNGMLNLCNAYSRKIHCQIYPKVVIILKQEMDISKCVQTGADNILFTNSPTDLTTILNEAFQIVLAKKIKDLTLKVLRVYTNIVQ